MGEEEMKQQPTATLIDGKGIAATIRNEVKEEVAQLKEKYGEDKVSKKDRKREREKRKKKEKKEKRKTVPSSFSLSLSLSLPFSF